jgi:hypothetical protein
MITNRSNRYIQTVTEVSNICNRNQNVSKGVSFVASKVYYFPLDIEIFLDNLEAIKIVKSELKEIRKEDLKPFAELKVLNFSHNALEILETDLFQFNPNLEVIILYSNNLHHIDSHVFDNFMNKLSTFYMDYNFCVLDDASNDKKEANKIIKTIQTGFCEDEEKLQIFQSITTIRTTSTLRPTTSKVIPKRREFYVCIAH